MSTVTSPTTPGFDLLSEFQDDQDNPLLAMAQPLVIGKDEVLIREGTPHPGLFIVTRGLLDVRVGVQNPVSVGKRGPGELLGEVSFLSGEPANATVAALEPSELLALPTAVLQHELHRNHAFAAHFYQRIGRAVARKLTEQSRRAVPFTVAITHSPELDARLRNAVHVTKARLAEVDAELSRQKGQVSDEARRRTHATLDEAMELLRDALGPESDIPAALRRDVAQYLRQEFLPFVLLSKLCEQSYTKPRGYAGDFQAIDMIYSRQRTGAGHLGALLDEYFLNISVSKAVRNRRGLLLEVFLELLEERPGEPLQITSLACGPAREVFDLFERIGDSRDVTVNCLDLDAEALATVGKQAAERGIQQRVRLLNENLILLAMGRHETPLPPQDLMYSIGLIDYFQDKLVIKLLDWVHKSLRPGGQVVLGNFDPRSPDRAFMDHLLEWPLIYRTPDDMRRLFASSRFGDRPVDIRYEQQGINLFASCRK